MKAVASRESEWIARFGTPNILDDPNRVLPGQGNREDHISSLSLYATLIPFLVPPLQEQKRPVLWHSDLHGSNIFIRPSEEGKVSPSIPISLTSIIDWQGSWIGPAFLHLKVLPLYHMDGVPPGKQLPDLPDHFDSLSNRKKEKREENTPATHLPQIIRGRRVPPLDLDYGSARGTSLYRRFSPGNMEVWSDTVSVRP